MTSSSSNASPDKRHLSPRLLLVGAVFGFVGCCLAGRVLAQVNCLQGFTRFHFAIDRQTLYYPTVSQVQAVAREIVRPDKVAVILGGNSILFGGGQGAKGNWANRLQELLGDNFRVVNFARYGGGTFEFGSVAAEALLRDHPRLIFVTNAWAGPLSPPGEPDGGPNMRYFYWQAWERGLLEGHRERDEALRRLGRWRGESFRELRRQCALDARLSFHDLWNAAAYRWVSTVWCPLLSASWTRPRRSYPDLDPIYPPATESQLQAVTGMIVSRLRGIAAEGQLFSPPPGREKGWREPASPLPQTTRECLPPSLRGRTLLFINHYCPYYYRELTAGEREGYALAFATTARLFERAGVHAREVGRDLPQNCYCDATHLTAEGGRRLAEEMAPHIRALAQQLGYLDRRGSAEAANPVPCISRASRNAASSVDSCYFGSWRSKAWLNR
jgi:hypothetical protein